MDDYYNHMTYKQAKLYIVSIVGVIISIICGIIIYPLLAMTSLDGALKLKDFWIYIFFRIITSLIYLVPQILMINNCRNIKKHYENCADKFIKETKRMSLKTFSIWGLFFIIGCARIYNIIW